MRAARIFAGLEQIPLAAELHVSRQTISNWETDRNDPPATVMIRWAELTRVSLDWLAWGTVRPEGFEPPAYCSVADGGVEYCACGHKASVHVQWSGSLTCIGAAYCACRGFLLVGVENLVLAA